MPPPSAFVIVTFEIPPASLHPKNLSSAVSPLNDVFANPEPLMLHTWVTPSLPNATNVTPVRNGPSVQTRPTWVGRRPPSAAALKENPVLAPLLNQLSPFRLPPSMAPS